MPSGHQAIRHQTPDTRHQATRRQTPDTRHQTPDTNPAALLPRSDKMAAPPATNSKNARTKMDSPPDSPATITGSPPASTRLLSLDALRGFDMFWIIGGESIVEAAAKLTGWAWLVWFAGQLQHPEWHGFALYDLIFPLFLFIAGVSMPFSFEKRLARGDSKAQLYRHVIKRGLLLVVLGMIYNGLLEFDWPNTRLPSVLGRIGLAYMFAALIVLNSQARGQLLWIAGLLVGYWAALKFIPVPGYGAGDLSPGHTLTDYIDRSLIPGHLYRGDRDPEGLLATIPAIGTALAGAVTGQLLKSNRFNGYVKSAVMVVAGLICLGLAALWNLDFPINKNLWSSSFVLHCAGLSLLLLALFYLVIDVWRFRAWTFFFVVIGSNSILAYLARQFVDFGYTANFFFAGAIKHTGEYQELFTALSVFLTEWLLLYVLYRKQIFLRI
jgi:predicted acyltransferase